MFSRATVLFSSRAKLVFIILTFSSSSLKILVWKSSSSFSRVQELKQKPYIYTNAFQASYNIRDFIELNNLKQQKLFRVVTHISVRLHFWQRITLFVCLSINWHMRICMNRFISFIYLRFLFFGCELLVEVVVTPIQLNTQN